MRSSLVLLLCFVLTSFASAQQKNDWGELKLKGKVKSIQTKETHRYKKNGVFTPWEKSYGRLRKFNSSGQLSEFSEFLANDSLSYKIVYTYQPKDKTGQQAYFDKTLKPTIVKKIIYNNKGQQTEQLEYTKDGQLDRRYTYQYDERGNRVEISCFKKDGTLTNRTTYKYDSKNNQTEYLVETPGYANSSKKFIYDEKGNMVEETWHDGQGALTFRFVRLYDVKGNKIQETSSKAGNKLIGTTKWKYEYDVKGNWIKKVDLTNEEEPFHEEIRTITYY